MCLWPRQHRTLENTIVTDRCQVEGVLVSAPPPSAPEKGVITKGVFSLEESLGSLKSLNSLEPLEKVGFPQSGGSLESLEALNSLESIEDGLF